MTNTQLTPSQAELLHKLSSNHMSPFETTSLLLSMFVPFIPFDWRLKIYFFVNTLHNQSFSLINFILITLVSIFLIFVVTKVLFIAYKLILLKKQLKNMDNVFLEIKPPHISLQSAYSTKELLAILHNLASPKSFKDKLFQKRTAYSLELVASKTEGIRYFVQVPEEEKDIVKKALLSYMPDLKIKESQDYLLTEKFKDDESSPIEWRITEFKQSNDFSFPLQSQKLLKEHDPIAYITGNMTKLSAYELISLQFVITPAAKRIDDKANRIINAILNDENVFKEIKSNSESWFLKIPLFLIKLYLFIILSFITVPLGILQLILSNGAFGTLFPLKGLLFPGTQKYTYNSHQKEIIEEVKQKLDQPLFEVSIKTLSILESVTAHKERDKGFVASLASFTNPGWQSLSASKPLFSFKKLLFSLFKQLSPSLFNGRIRTFSAASILSVSELSDLYHFPYSQTTKTENIVKVHAKELPAPLSLKQDDKDVVFAKNDFGGETTLIGLTKEERRRHVYVIGQTGSGKSTLLLSSIANDLKQGKGMAVIDPHGTLADNVLACIPKKRVKDVIYFDPDELEYPIGINLLELTPGLSENDADREKEFVCESVISLFRKVFSESMTVGKNAHRIESILRNTIYTSFTVPDRTIFTVYDLLEDPEFRNSVVNKLEDERLKKFWKNLFNKAGDWQQFKVISPVTDRIGRFLYSPSAKRILDQPKSTINFDKIMNEGKILVCNLSRGKLGEDTSEVLGIMIMNKLQLATLKRARVLEEKRRDFYLYVDEFQYFATQSFIKMLSEARKYRLNITMAEQTTSQQSDKNLVNIILANAGTVISFKSANPDDEKRILPQFEPYVEKGELYNLPAFHFYIKMGATNPEEAFSGETTLIETAKDETLIERIKQESRKNYATIYKKPVQKETNHTVNKEDKNNQSSGSDDIGSLL